MARIIGIRHRRKKTAEDKARPTRVAIKEGDKTVCYDLKTETDELDFLLHRFPTSREPVGDMDVEWFDKDHPNGVHPHHCGWNTVSKEEAATCRSNHIRLTDDGYERVTEVPSAFDGLKNGDRVAMALGGSGDRFAAALSRQGEEVGAEVFRIPPFFLKERRGDASKDDDHLLFTKLLEECPALFQRLRRKDRDIIRVKEALALREDAQKARIGCELRIHQSLVGRIFLSEDGRYPEGLIEDQYDAMKANDTILQGLIGEETRRNRELFRTVESIEVWTQIFEGVEGCGQRIAAGIIAAIGDIRRFVVPVDYSNPPTEKELASFERMNATSHLWQHSTPPTMKQYIASQRRNKAIQKTLAKVKAFCGVHVLKDGSFPRRRAGQLSNWNPRARQALYLFIEQCKRRPTSTWGAKLLASKAKLRITHPEPVEVDVPNGKGTKKIKRYTNGHIHKMAWWHTATKFTEWFSREWLKLEEVY